MMESSIDFGNQSDFNGYVRCACISLVAVAIVYVLFFTKKENAFSGNVMLMSMGIAAAAFMFVDHWVTVALVLLVAVVVIKKNLDLGLQPKMQVVDTANSVPSAVKTVFSEEDTEVEKQVEEPLTYDIVQSNLVNPANIMTEVRTFSEQLGPQGLSMPRGYDDDVQDAW